MASLFRNTCFLFLLLLLPQCRKDRTPDLEEKQFNFRVDQNYFYKNNQRFDLKGVVYVPGYPGYLPWLIEPSSKLPERLEKSIKKDLKDIKAMGANTVRFWGAPQYCYEALKEIGGLHFIQTIWLDGAVQDFQDLNFKEQSKKYIKEVIDRIYTVYHDQEPPLVAFIIGNELSKESILSTNSAHPDITSYQGNYIQTDSSINASEAFLAEMADYCRGYELENYQHSSLLAYANDIRTFDEIEADFLDFIAHNAYSYAVPYYRPNTATGSSSGRLFQGWIEELKAKSPDKALLISETGLSVSPNQTRIGPPNFGYGGNTEQDQANGIMANISDIHSAKEPIAGYCIHEYLDAWWKFGYDDSFSQDSNDIEEWFGIVKLIDSANWYSTEFRPVYFSLKNN